VVRGDPNPAHLALRSERAPIHSASVIGVATTGSAPTSRQRDAGLRQIVTVDQPTSVATRAMHPIPWPGCAFDCAVRGACKVKGGRCVIGSWRLALPTSALCRPNESAHCESSELCEDHGKCAYWTPADASLGGSCVVESSGDCQQSRACKLYGRCTHTDASPPFNRCQVGSDRDCADSLACIDWGGCRRILTQPANYPVCGKRFVQARTNKTASKHPSSGTTGLRAPSDAEDD